MTEKHDEQAGKLTAARQRLVLEHLQSSRAQERHEGSLVKRLLVRMPGLPRSEAAAPKGNLHDEIAWVLKHGTRPRTVTSRPTKAAAGDSKAVASRGHGPRG